MGNENKTTPVKTGTANAEAANKYEVADTPVYLNTKRYGPGESIDLTASQAKRLGTLVKPATAV